MIEISYEYDFNNQFFIEKNNWSNLSHMANKKNDFEFHFLDYMCEVLVNLKILSQLLVLDEIGKYINKNICICLHFFVFYICLCVHLYMFIHVYIYLCIYVSICLYI
jgi:hypothetical protein